MSELQTRNSMLPRHLRCTYAPQYIDENFTEDEIKVSRLYTREMEKTFTVSKSNPDLSKII